MRLKTYPVVRKPQEGDIKTIKRFAWWPLKVENKLLWLEWYNEIWEYRLRKRVILARWIYHKGIWSEWDFITKKLIEK